MIPVYFGYFTVDGGATFSCLSSSGSGVLHINNTFLLQKADLYVEGNIQANGLFQWGTKG